MIKKILAKLMPASVVKQLHSFGILANKYGQFQTMKKWECVSKDGDKIPWYTYPAIEYLNNLDFSKKDVFEYGSGNSSGFWGKRSRSVISIESNPEWYNKVKSGLHENQKLFLKDIAEEYENSIIEHNKKYDIIIIDGMRRVECAKVIGDFLNKESSEGYMVILDNSDWYRETSKYLREQLGLIEVDFHGFGPINYFTWTTSIFLSRNFNFKPLDDIQPKFSIAAVENNGE